tara:strand:- start:203 stop:595 length:393 start_codon:yes stop_codon:yes gene_type:complete
MKIFGIGTDIVNVKRVDKMLKRHGKRFKKKLFSNKEISYCDNKKNPSSFYAKRYAAKEAFSKAIGIGIKKNFNFRNIEISNDSNGKPYVILNGELKKLLKRKVKKKRYFIYLSLTDDIPWAQATVVISYS